MSEKLHEPDTTAEQQPNSESDHYERLFGKEATKKWVEGIDRFTQANKDTLFKDTRELESSEMPEDLAKLFK